MDSKFLTMLVVGSLIIGAIAGPTYLASYLQSEQPIIIQSTQAKWERVYTTSGDNTDFYQNWCIANNGVWFDSAECRFEHRIDYDVATRDLDLSKDVKISGKFAKQICDTMNIPCPENVAFDARADLDTGNINYFGFNLGVIYHFQIIDNNLFYMRDDVDGDWIHVNADITRYDNSDGKYSDLWRFSGDELGYYETWCNVFNGDWLNKSYECGFKDHQDYKDAKKDLNYVLQPIIEGERAEIFCEILHKTCDGPVVFQANYDPRTDVTYYEDWIEGFGGITIRITDNQISYAYSYNPEGWLEWAHNPETLERTDLQDNEILSSSQESESFKILQYGMFDAEDDGNLVDELYVGETYWFYIEYQSELDTRQDVRIFVIMQDKNTDNVLKKIDGHGFDKPEERFGHGFEWIPEYEGQFKIKGELRTLDDPFVSTIVPQYDFVVIEKP